MGIFEESVGPGHTCQGCREAKRKWRNGIMIKMEETENGWEACVFCDVPKVQWSEHLIAQLKDHAS